ncbi:PilZ domain-containing protein [Acidisarcina polymorpha]|uniref:PilZ domain-containing protein n=1 Tax=Acidisarcina polymorpha TaxID=2211140 RepID=UPI000DEF4F5D
MGQASRIEPIAIAKSSYERRKYRRFPCAVVAEMIVSPSGYRYLGKMEDLSLNGCYIAIGSAVPALERNAAVRLCLSVDGDSFTTAARVMLVRPESGVAFEFLASGPEIRSAHLALIQKVAATPSPGDARHTMGPRASILSRCNREAAHERTGFRRAQTQRARVRRPTSRRRGTKAWHKEPGSRSQSSRTCREESATTPPGVFRKQGPFLTTNSRWAPICR